MFDVEIDLLRGKQAAYSIVTMQSVSEFESLLKGFREQLYLWLGGAAGLARAALAGSDLGLPGGCAG